jgi:DNA-binding CsgD family transcriptional regulator
MAAISVDHARLAQAPLGFLRHILALPSDAGLFYAFGGSLERADAEPCPPLQAKVLYETQASEWWRDYRRHAGDRNADPIRSAIRYRTEPVRWRDYERRSDMSAAEHAMWRRARDLGLRDGVTVPLHDPRTRRYGVLSVLHFGRSPEFDDWIGGHRRMLGPAAYLAHLAISSAAPPLRSEAEPLSERERQCLALVAGGLSSKHIGKRLRLSPRTVELHVARGMKRLGAVTRSHAVALALRQNMLEF